MQSQDEVKSMEIENTTDISNLKGEKKLLYATSNQIYEITDEKSQRKL